VQQQKSTILIEGSLTLETRIGYICNTHGYQRGIIAMVLKWSLHNH